MERDAVTEDAAAGERWVAAAKGQCRYDQSGLASARITRNHNDRRPLTTIHLVSKHSMLI